MNEEEFFDALEIAYHDDEILTVGFIKSSSTAFNVSLYVYCFCVGKFKVSDTSSINAENGKSFDHSSSSTIMS